MTTPCGPKGCGLDWNYQELQGDGQIIQSVRIVQDPLISQPGKGFWWIDDEMISKPVPEESPKLS